MQRRRQFEPAGRKKRYLLVLLVGAVYLASLRARVVPLVRLLGSRPPRFTASQFPSALLAKKPLLWALAPLGVLAVGPLGLCLGSLEVVASVSWLCRV